MSTVPKPFLTEQQYLTIERQADYRSEFYRGEMFAMAGASRRHNLIAGNTFAALHQQLSDRDCEVYQGDMRVKVRRTGLYVYPDVVVACDNPRFEDDNSDVLLNPRVLIEVLSKSTEEHDRSTKWSHYRKLPSLRDFLLVSQKSMSVEQYTRADTIDGWIYKDYNEPGTQFDIESIGARLRLDQLYAKVNFDETEPEQDGDGQIGELP